MVLTETYEQVFGKSRPPIQCWIGFVTAGHEICNHCGGSCARGESWLCQENPDSSFIYKYFRCPSSQPAS